MLRCQPSSKVLFRIYTRNETFDNFPEEICRASRAFLLRSGTHLRYRVGNPFKTTSRSSGPEELVLLVSRHPRDTNHTRMDPFCSQERRIRPTSFTRFQRPHLYPIIKSVILVFSFKQANRVYWLSQIKCRCFIKIYLLRSIIRSNFRYIYKR